jgi:hypothetical protein
LLPVGVSDRGDRGRHEACPAGHFTGQADSFDSNTKSLYADPLNLRIKSGKSGQLTDMNCDFGLFRVRLVE